MKEIKGTQTEKNLLKSFAGESQARNRYTFFASKAREEGYIQISLVFEETANQEKEHGKRFFSYLQGGDVEITASYPAGKVGTTLENLTEAANGENMEQSSIYPEFSNVARSEGFEEIATLFDMVSVAERNHERRYRALAENVKLGKVFKRDGKIVWRCINCGFTHEGIEPPKVCPACLHPQSYYEIRGENW
ncbi:MAG: rubrerythrin family protein [Caldisericia bacterium]|nr:rubrerythrin family protein [Caldisericia bacterium]